MDMKKDGGPAFPRVYEVQPEEGKARAFAIYPGMSLRDYFAAAAALTALVSNSPGEPSTAKLEGEYRGFALRSYEIADAMIKARGEQ